MKPTLVFLGGLIVGMLIWIAFLVAFPVTIAPSNPIVPLFAFVVGLFLAITFFQAVAKKWPGSSLSLGNQIPFLHRNLIFFGGFILGFGYMLAAR